MADMKDKSEARKARVARVMSISCSHGGRMKCNEGCYSKGGEVKGGESYGYGEREKTKGVHKPIMRGDPGTSVAGAYIPGKGYGSNVETSKRIHRDVLGEMKSDKGDRRNLAAGGDVEPMGDAMPDNDGDELLDSCADELMEALEKKDKRGIVDAIRALVLNSKE